MKFEGFREYVAWKAWQEGLFYSDGTPVVMTKVCPSRGSPGWLRCLVNRGLQPAKLPKPKLVKVPPARLANPKVGQVVTLLKARFPG